MEEDIKKYIESLEKPKISIVMQCFLGDYPGSRFDSLGKFRRAIKSFENQLYKNCELVIVADGCNKTHQIYNREFKSNPNIKFVFLDRDLTEEPAMYNTIEHDGADYKVYRGQARALGVTIASGKLITYMDSDDYLAPEFTQTLLLIYNQAKEKQWWLNKTWYDNEAVDFEAGDTFSENMADQPTVALPYIHGLWKQTKIRPDRMVMSPWLFMHSADCTVIKWRDTFGQLSEDVDFSKRFRQVYPNGAVYEKPIYVRCHYSGKWDI